MSILPPDDQLQLIHTRTYDTRVYLVDDYLVARGAVRDRKPAGLLVKDDPDTIDMHHMVLELHVSIPDLTITAVTLDFESFPVETCPSIVDSYQQLIGVSIARGFSRRVHDLFGGPRGCTHVVALLLALAPSIVQSRWSLSAIERRRNESAGLGESKIESTMFLHNTNTCHTWAEDGPHITSAKQGRLPEPPIPVSVRLAELGRDPSEWRGV